MFFLMRDMENDDNASALSEPRILYKSFEAPPDVGKIEIVPDQNVSINSTCFTHHFGTRRNTKQYKAKSKHTKPPRAIWEHTQLKRHPQQMTCPNCLSLVETRVRRYVVCVTHVVALSLLPFCMCVLPYHAPIFKDTVHYCPNCQIFLGTCFAAGKKLSACCTKPRKCDEDT